MEVDKNSKTFLTHLQRHLISESDQVKRLGRSIKREDASILHPLTNDALNLEKQKASKIQKLAKQISTEGGVSMLGFIQKEVSYLSESKKVLEYFKRIQKDYDYCQRLGNTHTPKVTNPTEVFLSNSRDLDTNLNVFSNQSKDKADEIFTSPKKEYIQTVSQVVGTTPKVELITNAVSQKHQSQTKYARPVKRRLNSGTYVKEKVGENKYVYRLKNQSLCKSIANQSGGDLKVSMIQKSVKDQLQKNTNTNASKNMDSNYQVQTSQEGEYIMDDGFMVSSSSRRRC